MVVVAGCSDEKQPVVSFALASPVANNACPDGTVGIGTVGAALKVRVTVRQKTSPTDNGTFLCDRVVNYPTDVPTIRFDKMKLTGQYLDVWAEVFSTQADGSLHREATGVQRNIDRLAKQSFTVRLIPSAQFRCAPAHLLQARAFHSATLLPDGEVLFIGGAVPQPMAGSTDVSMGQLYGTGTSEVYDSITRTTSMVTDSVAPIRAFHDAILLNDTPPYQILLVGGMTTSMPMKPIVGPSTKQNEGGRLITIDSQQLIQPAFATTAAPAEVVTYDPMAKTLTHQTAPWAPTASFAAAGARTSASGPNLAVAGGVLYNAAQPNDIDATPSTTFVAGMNGALTRTATLGTQRVAARLAVLDADRTLVWGGARTLTGNAQPGELISGLMGGTGTSTPFLIGGPAPQFSTLSRLADQAGAAQLLVTGGYVANAGAQALQPVLANRAVQLLTVNGTTVTAAMVPNDYPGTPANCVLDDGHYRPAGWESATVLADGRVLITGGSPSTANMGIDETGAMVATCYDCDLPDAAMFDTGYVGFGCGIKQASVYAAGRIGPTGTMGIGRAGHTSTLLPDGTVLVSAGMLRVSPGAGQAHTTTMTTELEVYDTRRLVPPYDMNMPALGDQDDPFVNDLTAQSATRAPGENAHPVSSSTPLAICTDWN
jgi:hypothetical protein